MNGLEGRARPSFRSSYGRLAAAQKTSVGVSFYSRWVNRPLGRVFAAGGHVAGLTPNHLTAMSAVFTLGGLVLIATVPPHPLTGVAAGVLLLLGFALDSSDGQLARLRGGGSLLGEWLDHIVDSAKTPLVHVAVLIAAWRFYAVDPSWLLVPLVFLVIAVVQFSGILLTPFLLQRGGRGQAARTPSTVRSLALLPADYGVIATSFLLCGIPAVFVPTYTVLAGFSVVITGIMLAGWRRRLLAADSQSDAGA